MILLTFTLSPALSYLAPFYPFWHSNQPKAQLLDQPRALHNYSIIDTYSSFLILDFPLQYYFQYNSAFHSPSLNLLICLLHLLCCSPCHSDNSADSEHQVWLACRSILFHAAMTEWQFFFDLALHLPVELTLSQEPCTMTLIIFPSSPSSFKSLLKTYFHLWQRQMS